MKEIWVQVKDFEDYMVSNLGRVKSIKFGKERILKASMNSDGYLLVNLCNGEKVKTCYVHRLVAEVFLPNPNNLPCVNHRNENKQDNRVENLEWCTHEYNLNYGTRNTRVAAAHINHPQTSKQVAQINKETGEVIRIWPSTNECSRQTGFDNGAICNCANGKRYKSAYGFIWRYV